MRLHYIFSPFQRLNGRLLFKHLIGWFIFILYEMSFIRLSIGYFSPARQYICYYSLNILLFYVNAHLVFPLAIKLMKSYLWIPALCLVELIVYLIFKYILDFFLAFPANGLNEYIYIKKLLVPNAYRGIYFLGASILYWSVLRVISFRRRVHETETLQLTMQKEKAELERNLAEAMNAYLQQQINPHLLFNTLTFIHNTYYKYSREASQCVLLLVDIMRFSLEEVNFNGKTSLDKEIDQIRNFIELNQLRFDYELYIDFNTEGAFESKQIIPLILLTLTENILKKKNGQAKLYISVNDQNELKFISWNLKKHQPENKRLKSIGIKNVIKRLEHSYKHHYILKIDDEDESFGVELIMQL
jgi:two-component system LytT family sensor kinase